MKLTTGILISILTAGTALGQQQTPTPSLLDSIKAKLTGSQQPKTAAQNAALGNSQSATAQKTAAQTTNAATTSAKPSPAQAKTAANAAPAVKAQPATQANAQSKPAAPTSPMQAKASANTAPAVKVQAAVQAATKASASTPQATVSANKNSAPAAKSQAAAVQPAQAQPVKAMTPGKSAPTAMQAGKAGTKPQAIAATKETAAKADDKPKAAESKPEEQPIDKSQVAVEDSKTAANMKSAKKELNFTGHRDPFISPVVSRSATGSGCSTGKRCLAIDQINLKGVIKSEGGMIAVVTNSLDKAYFLRENDPVFNGYVVKITGDSVIFSESYEDKLGKPLTREVTKKLMTPSV